MRALPEGLIELSRRQAGLLSSPQLASAGFRRRAIDLRVDRGDWRRVSATVIAVHTQPITREAELWSAALHFERCGLAGPSVLELHGLPVPHDRRIHMIGPRAGWYAPLPLVVPHTATDAVLAQAAPLRVELDLAVLQCLRWAITPRQAIYFATWAMQRGLVQLESLQACASGLKKSPGTARMRERLALLTPGVHSVNEFDFQQECRRRGLPEPVRQRRRVDSMGRDRYLDAEFTVRGRRVAVEIDGLHHLETQVRVDDEWRANEMVLQGVPVLRIPAIALRLNPDPFFEQLERALLGIGQVA